jgi:hypothetical protein
MPCLQTVFPTPTICATLEQVENKALFDAPIRSTISAALEALAAEVDNHIKYYKGGSADEVCVVSLVPNPGAPNARANIFIRSMLIILEMHAMFPKHDFIARLASVALEPHLAEGTEISESMVKSSVREWKKGFVKRIEEMLTIGPVRSVKII